MRLYTQVYWRKSSIINLTLLLKWRKWSLQINSKECLCDQDFCNNGDMIQFAEHRSSQQCQWQVGYWQAQVQSPIQIPNPRTWAVTKISYHPTPPQPPHPPPHNFLKLLVGVHGSDRSPEYPWVSGRYPKSRWTVMGRRQGSPPCSRRTLSR